MLPSFPKSIIAKQRRRTFTSTMMVNARIRPKKNIDRPLLNWTQSFERFRSEICVSKKSLVSL